MDHRAVVKTLLAALLVVPMVSQAAAAADPSYGVPPDESLGRLAQASVVDVSDRARDDVDPVAIEETAFERAEAMPAWSWDVGELAVHLDYDPERAFEFVRERIRYEPYRGILRGASGTLAGRAGNAVDRALLLSALLDEMLIPHRFAFARLDQSTAERLVQRATLDDTEPLDGPLPYPTAAIITRAGRDYARLRDALGSRMDGITGDEWTTAVEAARDHVWVQRAMTAEWLDLDPSMPDGMPGETIARPDATSEQPPEMEPWTIGVEVLIETLEGGVLVERSVLDEQLDPLTTIGDGVFLVFRPELGAIGGAVTERLTGSEPWTPVLLMGSEEIVGTGFSIGGQGTDLLGDSTAVPDLASVRLEVTVDGPGMEPETASHVVLDRVPPARRALGSSVTRDDLEPLVRVESSPLPLNSFRHIMVSTGATNLRLHELRRGAMVGFLATLLDEGEAAKYGLSGRLWPLAVADEGLVVASEQMAVPGAGAAGGGRSFIAQPRVFMTTLGPDPIDPERQVSSIDLLLDDVRVLPPSSGAAASTALQQLWYGAMQTAIETEFSLHRLPADLTASAEFDGVSHSMDEPLHVIEPIPVPDLPAGTAEALVDATGSGRIVVVPGDVESAASWWTIDPGTGVTRSILEPGLGGAVRRQTGQPAAERILHAQVNFKYDGGVPGALRGDYKLPPRAPSGPPPVCGSSNQYVAVADCVSLRTALPAAFFALAVGFVVEAAIIQISWGW